MMVRLVSWRDIDSGPLQVIVENHTRTGAVSNTVTNVSPTGSPGLMALRTARRWSLGKITIKGSLTRSRNAK
jgi:hypothetical protein